LTKKRKVRRKAGQKAREGMNIARAEKKLRQAGFFLEWLEHASKKMGDPEHLEFYFSACLTAAQSAHYVLEGIGGVIFERVLSRLPEVEREKFEKMIDLRDDDVHFAFIDAEPRHKFVPEDPFAQRTVFRPRMPFFIAGEITERNPDGTTVRGSTLRGARGLYLEQNGRLIEAPVACHELIELLRSLLEKVKAPGP
jgi:hypothetical protein